jgi:ABC-type antimicrobial peptide transport system permease subunit
VLAGLLYGVAPGDPLSFAGAAAVLLVVSVAAMLVPARIALRVDPAQAMRSE